MRVHIYTGSLRLVNKSGVGQAANHQRAALQSAGVQVVSCWKPRADAVHINTVFPCSVLAALRARARDEKSFGTDTRPSWISGTPLYVLMYWRRYFDAGSAFVTIWQIGS